MKKNILLLFLIIFLGCQSSKKEHEVEQQIVEKQLDCSNAVEDKTMVELTDYNNSFFDENYTGNVNSYYNKDDKTIKSTVRYENGEITKYKSFYENGNPKIVKPIQCRSTHGNLIYYYENGNKGYELNFHLGVEDGIGKSYFENGNIEKVVHFKKGKKHGIQYDLSETGDTLVFETFKNGIKIK
jgi:antitoxin component YwqK of YwqJK toxin-antitoxin module